MKIEELSVSERLLLAEQLWDSVSDEDTVIELTDKQQIELDHKMQSFENDQDVGSPWHDVKNRIIGNL
jgi:putative addiction module component (TIGR02574 family)